MKKRKEYDIIFMIAIISCFSISILLAALDGGFDKGTNSTNSALTTISNILFIVSIIGIIVFAIFRKRFIAEESVDLTKERDKKIHEIIKYDSVIRLNFYHEGIKDSIYINKKEERFALGRGNEFMLFDMNDISGLDIQMKRIKFWLKEKLTPIILEDDEDNGKEGFINDNIAGAIKNIFDPYINKNKLGINEKVTVEKKVIVENHTHIQNTKEEPKYVKCPYCGTKNDEHNVKCTECGGQL